MNDPSASERRAGKRSRPAARYLIDLSPASRYAIAVGAALVATLARLALQPVLGDKLPFVLFFPAVMVGGWAGGFWPGAVTTLLSAAAAGYFWTPPAHSFRVAAPVDIFGLCVFVIVGLGISALNEAWRRGAAEILRSESSLKEKERAGRIEAEVAGRQLRLAVDASPTAMLIVDREGSIHFANAPTEKLFGYTARELTRLRVEDLVPPRFRGGHAGLRTGFFHASSRRPMGAGRDLYGLRKDGSEVPIEIGLSPFETPEGTLVLAAVSDITERKRAETERVDLLRREQEAARRKDVFLATLSHELRNPLAPIRNAAHVLGKDVGLAHEARTALGIIERQLDHLVRLVDDLLDLSRISQDRLELRRKLVPLGTVLDEALESSRPLIEEHRHALTVTTPDDPIWVDADLVRLTQVFTNIFNNAAKFTPAGGRIVLEVTREGADAVVRIRDDGEGFDEATRELLFEMFAQPPRAREKGGLGIGLALAKRLTTLHGGSLEGRSAGPGRGSEFEVRLAAAEPPADAGRRTPEGAEPATRHRILVAEDNEDAAEALAMLLSLSGHEIRTARDGEEACEIAATFRPDVALLDIGMPRVDGYEAARRIREQPGGEGVLLVALTGWGQPEDRRRSAEAGFALHLTKPVDPAALEKLLSLPWPPPRDDA